MADLHSALAIQSPQKAVSQSVIALSKTIVLDVIRNTPHGVVIVCGMVGFMVLQYYSWTRRPSCRRASQGDDTPPPMDSDNDLAAKDFVDASDGRYKYKKKLPELGSRMRKSWYLLTKTTEQGEEERLLTVAPVSQSCPLQLHEHQKRLNKLTEAIKLYSHPYVHPIDEITYLDGRQVIAVVLPLREQGSLKDSIYKVDHPTYKHEWSSKYAHCSRGLSPEDVARYGRQILEAMLFLYGRGFPPLGHVQSGNVFVVNGVCRLGGYENTLLGYKTRLFRLCKDHTAQLDVILFGHLIFEMSAGYELTQIRPGRNEYQSVSDPVKPVLEFIFTEGFPHSIEEIASHEFFRDVPIPELASFNANSVKLASDVKDSVSVVLEKVRKNKPRVQKSSSSEGGGLRAQLWRFLRSSRQVRLPQLVHRSRGKKE